MLARALAGAIEDRGGTVSISEATRLRISCRKHDWTNALFEGKVAAAGPYELEVRDQENVPIDGLFGASPVADYGECGLAGLIQARVKGTPIKALPVFI